MNPNRLAALALAAAACGPATETPDGQDPKPVFTMPVPKAVRLSAAGPDQLQAVVAGPGGTFYAAGYSAAEVAGTSPRGIVVLKLGADGALDTSFGGGDGIASTPLVFKGASDEIDLVVQSTGKIVVATTIASATNADDRDVGLTRLAADGTVDTTFGDAGVRVLDLSTGLVEDGKVTGPDASRALAVDATDRIYVHAVQRGEGEGDARTDTDFALVRLSAEGALDATFGTNGKHLLDLKGPTDVRSSATPRGIAVLADGSVIGSGYATTEGIGTGAQPVLYKVDSAGARVAGFATGGVFHAAVLALQTEIYNFAVHGTQVVTAGYGRDTGELNDWVSLRFDVTTGARDTTWGGTTNGAVVLDPSGKALADNCRNAVALPGGRTLLMGSAGPSNAPEQDAAFAILDATGKPDTSYGDGVYVLPFGDGLGGNDQIWGAAVSGTNVLMVGTRGGGAAAAQTAETNDDAYVLVLPLR